MSQNNPSFMILLLLFQITAGEQIDLMFGAKLGLSSMAAAGLGNTVADVVGINISHTIEVIVTWQDYITLLQTVWP